MIFKILRKVFMILKSNFIKLKYFILGSRISFGTTMYLHKGSKISIGKGVRIGKGVLISILPGGELSIDDNSIINFGAVIYVAKKIKIGRNVHIAHYSSIIDHNYKLDKSGPNFEKDLTTQEVFIGNGVWIGANALILKGASVGNNSVVSAGSILSQNVPSNHIVTNERSTKILLEPLR